ncbi:ABC transporter ATP-binding protein [Candidatus Bathyarchaeota archaeon]|nr:ABC transporter ATP-binding protein [Candidatus Bathyarchaeota archaeon]
MIKVEDVYFTYPSGVEALRGVTLRIEDGEFVTIMGENGAGKTTLVKHFNGLLKPTRGRVEVDGIDTRNASVAELSRNVGLVFQNSDHQLFSETVEEEIAFGLRNFGFDAPTITKRVEWALNLLDLVEYRKSSPFMLSGGERKRLALASVLAWDPKIIVLDEPTIGQDYQQKAKLREFITQLNAQKRTVIVVTHDVEFVAECRPRVVLMSHGEVVADGPAPRILTDYDTVTKVSLLPPQVTQIFLHLSDFNFPSNVIDIYEAKQLLSARMFKVGLK